MKEILREYPFRCTLSLEPLIDYWGTVVASSDGGRPDLVGNLQQRLEQAPELRGVIEDPAVLESHGALLSDLMSVVFPPAMWETQALAATVPFLLTPFLASPEFERLMVDGNGSLRVRPLLTGDEYVKMRLIRAYHFILRECYGISEGLISPLIHKVVDEKTGLDRYFRFKPNFRFMETRNNGGPVSLTEEQEEIILHNLTEPEVLRTILRPECFEFRGFIAVEAVDVTTTEVLSALEKDLIDRDSMFSQPGFMRLQDRLRTLFANPNLVAGIAAITKDQVLLMQKGCDMSHNCIFAASRHVPIQEFEGSIFEQAAEKGDVLLIRDLSELPSPTRADLEVLEMGIRSLLVAPLYYQGSLIGTMDLCSPLPGDFDVTAALQLKQMLPLFSMALQRGMDELHNNVQAIIKEKCTAVHPSVEWRFQKAVLDHLERCGPESSEELEPIVFRDVYPLYGSSDIRGSSDARNASIRSDLSEHIMLSLEVVRSAAKFKALPILKELAHRLHSNVDHLQTGLTTGDEAFLIRFLREEVEPLFPTIAGFDTSVASAIKAYEAAITPELGTVYKKRKDFEESVSRFNSRLSAYLDREEAEAQALFPHYFNKHQTDGLEYTIYMGRSMVENGGFNEVYLKNMRLWQMIVACGIAWHTRNLKSQLKVPLDATHLILVSHSPLSIRFRFDEKRFDVDGAYDIAHEIVRSRLDKATVKGGSERLTQTDRIAIVYSNPAEWREMVKHIDFLQAEGYLLDDVESLDLEDLPGVQGLKALRVGINVESPALAERALGESR
jgi:hypothetical protein